MTVFGLAGKYGPNAILSQSGVPFALGSVTVYLADGVTPATLYTDQTQGSGASNPVSCDAFGNLQYFTQPGINVLSFTIGGVTTTLTVQVLPWNTDISPGTVIQSYIVGIQALASSGITNITSVSLPAGTWLVTATCLLISTDIATYACDVFIGPTSASATSAYTGQTVIVGDSAAATEAGPVQLIKKVALTTTTTVYLMASNPSTGTIDAVPVTNGESIPNCTGICAIALNAQT